MIHAFRLTFVSLVAVALMMLAAMPAAAQGRCMPLSGTITGQFDGMAWVGRAYVKYGDNAPLALSLRDDNNGIRLHPGGLVEADGSRNFAGYEILTFKGDNAYFQVAGQFVAVASRAPYAYLFSETGKIMPGASGVFDGMTGDLSIHGSFATPISPDGPDRDPWVWLAEVSGTVCAN